MIVIKKKLNKIKMASNMKVVNLWIIYLVILVGLCLILYVVVSKNSSIGFGSAAFFAAIISGITVYLVAQYNVDVSTLSKEDINSLNALYITMGAIALLGFIILIISLVYASRSNSSKHGQTFEKITLSNCEKNEKGEIECSKEKIKVVKEESDGSVSVHEFFADERGVTPKSFSKRFKDNNQVKVKYLLK